MIVNRTLQQLILVLVVLALIGCVSVGTRTLPINQRGFNGAIIYSTEQQLLLNIVRIQFEDRPFFMSVESVTTSNSLSISGGPSLSYSPSTSGSDSTSLDGLGRTLARSISQSFSVSRSFGFTPNASYSDSPTISYAPLQGEKFTRQMLTSVNINTLFLLLHSGWNPERVMRTMVERINGFENSSVISHRVIPEFRQFKELAKLLQELQEENVIYFSTGVISSISMTADEEIDLHRRYGANKVKTDRGSDLSTSENAAVKSTKETHLSKLEANTTGSSKS